MANIIFYLSTCDTCRRILKEIRGEVGAFQLQDIKKEPLTLEQLTMLREKAGSYEALVNKRATRYKDQKLAEKKLSEDDFKALLLQHYSFLKRPTVLYAGQLFIGNDKRTIDELKLALME